MDNLQLLVSGAELRREPFQLNARQTHGERTRTHCEFTKIDVCLILQDA